MSASGLHSRGDVYMANLDPQKGSEQGGVRPVLILQIDLLNRVGNTVVVIPFTTQLKRAKLPSALLVSRGEGGLPEDSVALCHQIRVLDKSGLQGYVGTVSSQPGFRTLSGRISQNAIEYGSNSLLLGFFGSQVLLNSPKALRFEAVSIQKLGCEKQAQTLKIIEDKVRFTLGL